MDTAVEMEHEHVVVDEKEVCGLLKASGLQLELRDHLDVLLELEVSGLSD